MANVVYLEQPAFVGFSYSNDSANRNTGDKQSTADNYVFVKEFINEYTEYQGRDTYFTGESYGGEYVPTLTAAVLGNSSSQIYKQFQGFMIGNPVMFTEFSGSSVRIFLIFFFSSFFRLIFSYLLFFFFSRSS